MKKLLILLAIAGLFLVACTNTPTVTVPAKDSTQVVADTTKADTVIQTPKK